MDVIGVDFAVALLNRACDLAADLRLRARWIRGDMRLLPLRSETVTAALLMDAFGFFDTEDENEAVLREAARVLRPGGRLGLKVVNGGPILDAFHDQDREEREGTVVAVSRTLTFGPPRMTERISVSGSRGSGEYERRQRLYRVEELRSALEGSVSPWRACSPVRMACGTHDLTNSVDRRRATLARLTRS